MRRPSVQSKPASAVGRSKHSADTVSSAVVSTKQTQGRARGQRQQSAKAYHQLLVRLSPSDEAYLATVVPEKRDRAAYMRKLLAREKARRERRELMEMFAAAAKDVTDEDRAERRALVGGFANHE